MGTWQMMTDSVAVDRTTSVADPKNHAASCSHELLLTPPPDPTQTQKAYHQQKAHPSTHVVITFAIPTQDSEPRRAVSKLPIT